MHLTGEFADCRFGFALRISLHQRLGLVGGGLSLGFAAEEAGR